MRLLRLLDTARVLAGAVLIEIGHAIQPEGVGRYPGYMANRDLDRR